MSHLETLLVLNETLRDYRAARARLDDIPDWMSDLHAEHSARQAEIDAEAERVEEAEKARRDAETKVSDAQEKLKRFQAQISQVTNQREYGALLKEIDTTKAEIKQQEEVAITAMADTDEAQAKLDEQRAGFADLDSRYQKELQKWEAEKPSVEKTATELEARLEATRAELTPQLVRHFDRLDEKTRGTPMSEIRILDGRGARIWHCSACSFNVRPQIVVEIRGGAIHACDSCKRILFVVPEDDA
ncbi:MAG: hypothetical protein AAGC60_11475 [Acidobacteriota bacterium]